MKTRPTKAAGALRRRAEARLRQDRALRALPPVEDARRLVHELQVHQVELEMQNAELLRTRNELEISLANYTDLYDFAPEGYCTLGLEGRIRQVNLTGAALLGGERSGLLGRTFSAFVAPGQRPAWQAFLQQVFAVAPRSSAEFELAGLTGSTRAVNVTAQRLPNGQECRLVIVDMTERKRVVDQVRVSEIRYRRLFESARDGVLLLDPATSRITDANPFMTKLLGYSHNQLVGRQLFEIGLIKDEAASREMVRELKKSHQVRYENLPLESNSGRHQEVEVVANLYMENGQPVIQCNIRDITERKLAEQVMRRNEALFSTVVAQVPVGVYVINARLQVQEVNPLAGMVFKNIQPLLGRDFGAVLRQLWPRQVADRVLARFRHTLRTGETYQSPEFAHRRRDTGVREIYEWQIQRVILPAGEAGVVCYFNDITERKRVERTQRRLAVLAASNEKLKLEVVRRQASEGKLRQSRRTQTRLLQEAQLDQGKLRELSHQLLQAQEEERKRISRELHDIITQTLVGINLHLAALGQTTPASSRGLRERIALTQKLVATGVDTLHRFATELRPTVLDDLGLIPALHNFMKEFLTRTGVRVSLNTFATLEQLPMVQRTVLYRVTLEALNNVARHAHASRVDVSFTENSQGVVLAIRDDGQSFDVERINRLKGNGRLGLLGMRERLEMVGGHLTIESIPGTGTTIQAVLPAPKAKKSRSQAPGSRRTPPAPPVAVTPG